MMKEASSYVNTRKSQSKKLKCFQDVKKDHSMLSRGLRLHKANIPFPRLERQQRS